MEVALAADRCVLVLIPGMAGFIIFSVLLEYSHAIGLMWISNVTYFICFLANIILNYIFLNFSAIDYVGPALALSISLTMMPMVQGGSVILHLSKHRSVWKGWKLKALTKWSDLFLLLFPYIAVQFLWIFSFEVGIFLAGLLGKSHLAAQAVLLQVHHVALHIAGGVSAVSASIIHREIEDGDTQLAKSMFVSHLLYMSNIAMYLALLFVLFGFKILQIFSRDPEVIRYFIDLIPYFSLYLMLIFPVYMCVTLLYLFNYRSYLMIMNFIFFYMINLPVAIVLIFVGNSEMRGLWICFVSSCCCYLFTALLAMCNIDWKEIRIEKRAKVTFQQAIFDYQLENTSTPKECKFSNQRKKAVTRDESKQIAHSKIPVISAVLLLLMCSVLLRNLLPSLKQVETKIFKPTAAVLMDINVP